MLSVDMGNVVESGLLLEVVPIISEELVGGTVWLEIVVENVAEVGPRIVENPPTTVVVVSVDAGTGLRGRLGSVTG